MWPFRRKTPAIDRRDMSEVWQVGDLAVCLVDYGWPNNGVPHPRKGDQLRVNRIIDDVGNLGYRCYGLGFEGKPYPCTWESSAFRKLRPTLEPASDEFIAELHDRLHHKERI